MPPHPATDRIDFLSPLSILPKFGPRRVEAMLASGIENLGQLLYLFPRRHLDRSTVTTIHELSECLGEVRTITGTITRTRLERGRKSRLRIQITDETGTMEALWFSGIPYLRASLQAGKRCLMTAKVGYYNGPQMVHPLTEFVSSNPDKTPRAFVPQYRVSLAMKEAGIGQKMLINAVEWTIRHMRHFPRALPQYLEEHLEAPDLRQALKTIHFPDDLADIPTAMVRITYEKLYKLALMLRYNRATFAKPGRTCKSTNQVQQFTSHLPFTLTKGQTTALECLLTDAASPRRMHRMLQGDVGSGKTVVACAACLPALESGLQVAWLAPTEILAFQTHKTLKAWLEPLGYTVSLLTGSTPEQTRRPLLASLAASKTGVIVGTHALLQPRVRFGHLGMAVVDEQHRFGVEQRQLLLDKDPCADFLLMSATPIPHTLARTLYGDLEMVTIDSRPQGRLPVSTHLVPKTKRAGMEQFIRKQTVDHGASAYYVVPRVGQSDDEDLELADVQSSYKSLTSGSLKGITAALIHGQLPPEEKKRIIEGFAEGSIKVLVATTVIEVGIDSPDAQVVVIENAERFGLSQLHQLRGRVGRGSEQSWCFLLTASTTPPETIERLRMFTTMSDGFAIAELDLKTRGPGSAALLRQSGWDDPDIPYILDNLEIFREIQHRMDAQG